MTDTITSEITAETDIVDLIDAYLASWNDEDPAARAELVRRVWADDGQHVDPLLDAAGHGAIADMLGAVHEQFPGHQVRRMTAIDTHHDVFRFGWSLVSPDGGVVVAGLDVGVRAQDGRIQAVAGFFGDLPES